MDATDSISAAAVNDVLTVDALHLALTRCMAAHLPCNADFQMHPDANTIASLWGAMSYERRVSIPVDEVDPKVMVAYRRWGPDFEKGKSE